MSLRRRVQRLEQHLGRSRACPACRDRGARTVLVSASQRPDGSVAPASEELPEACARCGEVAERVIEIVEIVLEPPGPRPAA